MLKTLLSRAVSAPPSLAAFVVREVEKAILTGRREALGGVDHEPGVVASADVDALRALVFAPARGPSRRVDRAIAEALFDIAHATATANNAPEFADFFAKAVGNYLVGAEGVAAPAREEAIHMETELARPGGFGAFLAHMFAGKATGTRLDETAAIDRADHADIDPRLAAAANVDVAEAKWVIAHLTRGGPLTAAERRLLAFLRDEATSAPPELSRLYAQAA